MGGKEWEQWVGIVGVVVQVGGGSTPSSCAVLYCIVYRANELRPIVLCVRSSSSLHPPPFLSWGVDGGGGTNATRPARYPLLPHMLVLLFRERDGLVVCGGEGLGVWWGAGGK